MKLKSICLAWLLVASSAMGACAGQSSQVDNCGSDSEVYIGSDSEVYIGGDSELSPGDSDRVLRVSILGDSYSTFEGWIPEGHTAWYKPVPKPGRPTDVTSVDQTWWKIFIDGGGYRLEKNDSYSGSTVCNTGYEGQDYSDRSFITRMDSIGNPDLILVFGGTNDDWAGVPMGEYVWSDWTPGSLYTYRPAAAYLVSHLQEAHPDAEIIVMVNDEISDNVKEATAEICRHYGVKCLQLEEIEKMSGHPDALGMKQIAARLQEFIMSGDEKNAF